MSAILDPSTKGGAHALERLASEKIGWLTTVTPDGLPQSAPIWFLWTGDEIFLYSHRTAKRNANLATNQQVSFNLNTDVEGDDVLTMEGTARLDPTGPRYSDHPAYVARYDEKLKGYGWEAEYFEREYPHVIRVTPTRWRGVG
jgi:PPOX class probable F420-dependent enzyme